MKAYKATYNGKCINITYEVGKTYTFEGKLIECKQGFHFCRNINDVFKYYSVKDDDIIVYEIEVLGDIEYFIDKSLTNKFKVVKKTDIVVKKTDIEEFVKYNKNNNLIYYKDHAGHKWWKDYDENNNLIHHKSSSGSEYWKDYDENNNMIHYKSSSGSEYWNDYDENNNLINYKSSDNEWKITIG